MMNRAGTFFDRHGFTSAADQFYYRYLGYCRKNKKKTDYPVTLHFGRNEIVFLYHAIDGRTWHVFSLYVAEGKLNQTKLTDKIQAYWHKPKWNINQAEKIYQSDSSVRLITPRKLLNEGYFMLFCADAGDDDAHKESECVDFRRLLLDFLFELEFTNTFEDKNFFHHQSLLQNNPVINALARKCLYLKRRTTEEKPSRGKSMSRPFRKSEAAWLNVCFQERHMPIFTAATSVFAPVEDEVAKVLFSARIGSGHKTRRQLFADNDVVLRNKAATFFMRRYSIIDAFRVLLPPVIWYLVPFFLLLIPFGDLLFSITPDVLTDGIPHFADGNSLDMWCPVPFWAYIAPLLMVAAGVLVYWRRKINMFRLMLPRMFFGVMVGWSIFWTSEDLWKLAVTTTARSTLAFSLILLLLVLLYVFSDISNRLERVSGADILGRSLTLTGFAIVMSLLLGFYTIQFKARPMLANSDFLNSEHIYQLSLDLDKNNPLLKDRKDHLELLAFQHTFGGRNYIELKGKSLGASLSWLKYGAHDKLFTLRYIWSVLLGQTMMSIMTGVVLQLLWEERPITEPL